MIRIGRHINGVILNPLEYLLDENDEIMYFDHYHEADQFLLDHGYTESDLDSFVFEEVEIINGKPEVI